MCPLQPGWQQWEAHPWRAPDRGFDHTLTHHINHTDMPHAPPQPANYEPVNWDLPTDHLADTLFRIHLHH